MLRLQRALLFPAAVLALVSGLAGAKQLTEGVYDYRSTPITGAFGLPFGQPLSDEVIVKPLGWMSTDVPGDWSYSGTVPFRMDSFLIRPPGLPRLLRELPGRYLVRTNFDSHPVWITATLKIPQAKVDQIRDVLGRMYQKIDDHYTDGTHRVELTQAGAVTRLTYFDVAAFNAYMERRNVTLERKFKEPPGGWGLSMTERQIISLARSFRSLRPDFESVYGVEFLTPKPDAGAPDRFHTLAVPKPLPMPWKSRARYELMVSPDGVPVNLRLNVTGTKPQLAYEKWVIEEALMLVFRGFLKRTENHTVLLMGGNSVAVALRDGELFVSVINGHQNRLALAREEERARAAALATRIAKRRKEMRDEHGF